MSSLQAAAEYTSGFGRIDRAANVSSVSWRKIAITLIDLDPGGLGRILNDCNRLFTTVETRFKPGPLIFHWERSRSDSPLGRRLCWNESPILLGGVGLSKTNSVRRFGGGYKAMKFRFLLF